MSHDNDNDSNNFKQRLARMFGVRLDRVHWREFCGSPNHHLPDMQKSFGATLFDFDGDVVAGFLPGGGAERALIQSLLWTLASEEDSGLERKIVEKNADLRALVDEAIRLGIYPEPEAVAEKPETWGDSPVSSLADIVFR